MIAQDWIIIVLTLIIAYLILVLKLTAKIVNREAERDEKKYKILKKSWKYRGEMVSRLGKIVRKNCEDNGTEIPDNLDSDIDWVNREN